MDDVRASSEELAAGWWWHGFSSNNVPASKRDWMGNKHDEWCHLFHLAVAQLCHGQSQREWWSALMATLSELILSDKESLSEEMKQGEAEVKWDPLLAGKVASRQILACSSWFYIKDLSNVFDKADGQKRWTRVIKRYYLHCESQTGPHRQCPVFLWASIPVKEWNVRLVLCRVWLTTRRCRRFKHKYLFVCLYLRHLSWEVSGASPALSHTRSPIWGDKDGNRVFQQRKVHLSPWQRERWED